MKFSIPLAGPIKISDTGYNILYTTPNNEVRPEITHIIIAKLNVSQPNYTICINTDELSDSKAIYYRIPTLAQIYTIREIFNEPLGLHYARMNIGIQCSIANAITVTLLGNYYE